MEAVIEFENLASFRASLKRADKNLDREFGQAQRELGRLLVTDAKGKARASRSSRSHFASQISMSSTATRLRLTVRNPDANAAFWGAKKRTGWNAYSYLRKNAKAHTSVRATGKVPGPSAGNAVRYRRAPKGRQHPPWVGNSWQAGVKGQGPYALNDAIADNRPRIFDLYSKAVEQAAEGALTRR